MSRSFDLIAQAWEVFHANGTCDEALLSPPILRSWQRCAAAGLDARYDMSSPDGAVALVPDEAQKALVRLVRPSMEDLYEFMEGSGFAVLLADAAPTVIEIIGDHAMVETLQLHRLGQGASCREERIGTMALNLALQEALPWQTSGAEHFCASYHRFACSAAPLYDINGQAMGVLGVLGYREAAHPHTLGMVIAAAQAIHAQVHTNMLLADTNHHLAELNAAIEAMNAGIILLDAQGRISKMNGQAGEMLGLVPRSAAGQPFGDLIEPPAALGAALERRQIISDQELLFPGRKGTVVIRCSIRPIFNRGRRYLGALITLRLPEHVHRLIQQVVGAQARFAFADIIGQSPKLQAAIRHGRIAAKSSAPVLLLGEPGVGKELFAHAIHHAGPRASGPLVALDCAAVPRRLLMGELLGYEGGQASRNEGRPGKLELAHGGTLLLQEIGALTMEAQTSLLRVIETRHLIRLDGQRAVPVDVRVIATSNDHLERAVAEGRFRAELLYRLSVLTIAIPPLRARGDDVLLLLDQILTTLNSRMGRQVLFAPEALAALRTYDWPGNVRELEVTLERLLHMTEKSVLTLEDLPSTIALAFADSQIAAAKPAPQRLNKDAAERDAILRAGRKAAGHLGRVAAQLGISRATLWRKMKLHGLTKELLLTTPAVREDTVSE